MDRAFDSCLKDTGLNPAEVGHYLTTVSKLFTPTVPSGAEISRLNQLTAGIACVGFSLLSLLSLIGG